MLPQMTFTDHELAELSRMARAAEDCGKLQLACTLRDFVKQSSGVSYPCAVFDAIKSQYRAWLTFGEWPTA